MQMATPSQLRGINHTIDLSGPRADEENDSTAFCDARDDTACSPQVGGCYIQWDDVDSLADAKDVSRIDRVPKGRRVAEMGLRREEEFECNAWGWGRVPEEGDWFVERIDLGTEIARCMPWIEWSVPIA